MTLRGGPTQDEVLAISLMKAELREGDVFADLGCGTGKVSIAASRSCSKVYAVDLREEAIEYARREIEDAKAEHIELFHGNAVDFLEMAGHIDVAFLGGSKDMRTTLGLLHRLGVRKIVVNAVLLRTLNEAIETLKELGIFKEAIHVQVGRSHELANSVMFKPIDPVYIIIGENNIMG